MDISITEIYESGGGHTSYDFEINPHSSVKHSGGPQSNLPIEKHISQDNLIIPPPK